MERMFRVQTVKVTGRGFNSMSPERRRKARTEGLRKRKVCNRHETPVQTVMIDVPREGVNHNSRTQTVAYLVPWENLTSWLSIWST